MPNLKQMEMLQHPKLLEACQQAAPKGYRPIRQFIRRTIQDGIRRVKEDTGLSDVTAIRGHYEIRIGNGDRTLAWCNYGCLVFGRGEPKTNGVHKMIENPRLVRDPVAKKLVPAIKDQTRECPSCGDSPVVAQTGLCSVCTWGDDNWSESTKENP